jgi:hypothetical protein
LVWLRIDIPYLTCRNLENKMHYSDIVFALIVTERSATSWFRNNSCKDDSALFSRFLHGTIPDHAHGVRTAAEDCRGEKPASLALS